MCDLISRSVCFLFFFIFFQSEEFCNSKEKADVFSKWFQKLDVFTQSELFITLFGYDVCVLLRKDKHWGDNFTSKQLFKRVVIFIF